MVERWGWPGGRPEGDESWEQTLRREILEETCSVVNDARLLGFCRSACLSGRRNDRVLVRSIWRARSRAAAMEATFRESHIDGSSPHMSCPRISDGKFGFSNRSIIRQAPECGECASSFTFPRSNPRPFQYLTARCRYQKAFTEDQDSDVKPVSNPAKISRQIVRQSDDLSNAFERRSIREHFQASLPDLPRSPIDPIALRELKSQSGLRICIALLRQPHKLLNDDRQPALGCGRCEVPPARSQSG